MDTQQFEHVLTLAEVRNFHRAAKQLKIGQPALTRSIQSFEAEIGLKVFDRSSRSVAVSAAGRAVIERVRAMLEDSRSLLSEAAMLAAGRMGHLAIGTGVSSADAFVRAAVQQFTLDNPGITVRFEVNHRRALLERLERHKIEIIFSALNGMRAAAHIRTEPLWRVPHRFYCRAGHPLLPARHIEFADVVAHGAALPPLLASPRALFAQIAGSARKLGMPNVYQTNDAESLKWVALNSNRLLFAAQDSVLKEVARGSLVELTFAGGRSMEVSLGVLRLRDHALSPAADRLLEMVRAGPTRTATAVKLVKPVNGERRTARNDENTGAKEMAGEKV